MLYTTEYKFQNFVFRNLASLRRPVYGIFPTYLFQLKFLIFEAFFLFTLYNFIKYIAY